MLPYFLNEGLCAPVQEMENVRRCSLWVKTLKCSSHTCDCSKSSDVEQAHGHKVTSSTELKEDFQDESNCSLSPAKKVKLESSVRRRMSFVDALRQHEAWILDIDLDFFSTRNPFRKRFTEVILSAWLEMKKGQCTLDVMYSPLVFTCAVASSVRYFDLLYVVDNVYNKCGLNC